MPNELGSKWNLFFLSDFGGQQQQNTAGGLFGGNQAAANTSSLFGTPTSNSAFGAKTPASEDINYQFSVLWYK